MLSAKKLQEDLSVQFAVGLALYELWIKQGRTDNTEELNHLVMVGGDDRFLVWSADFGGL